MSNPLVHWWLEQSFEKQVAILARSGMTPDDLHALVTLYERSGSKGEEAQWRALSQMLQQAARAYESASKLS